ncbi:MAG: MMPL family transporter, partial [Clostridia bacterium]
MGKDIVKYRYIILIFFAILLAVSVAFLPKMISKVNYDLTSYLPAGYDTYDGYQFLSEQFNIHGDVEIGVEATYDEAKKVVNQITAIDGVTSATWADMLTYMIDFGIYAEDDANFIALRKVLTDSPTMTNDGQKHNWAVLVTLKYPPSSTEAIEIFQKIKTALKDTVGATNYSMSGMTEQANALFETVFDEIGIYCIIAGIVVLFLLAITTSSLMEPIILLLTMVISILINLGTNVLFPSTSIITFACTAILQIGLSMDYALFLLH